MAKSAGRNRRKKKTVNPGGAGDSEPVGTQPPNSETLTFPEALDRAVEHHVAGRLDAAAHIYSQVLAADPNQPMALHLLGMVNHQAGQSDVAVELIHRALEVEPGYMKAHYNLGTVLTDLGRLEEAMNSYRAAIKIDPDYARAYTNLGNVLHRSGRLEEARQNHRKAVDLEPDLAEAHNNLGNALKDLGELNDAATSYRKAIAISPGFADAHYNLGIVLKDLALLDDAIASYRTALVLDPQLAEAHSNLGNALLALGRLDEASTCFTKALDVKPDYAAANSNLIFCEQYRPEVTPDHLSARHAQWERAFGVPLQKEWRDHDNSADPGKRMRIGFVSPSLGRHPVGYFVLSLFENRPKHEFEIYCYSDRTPDDLTERFCALSDCWVDARGLSDDALSTRIRKDRIDVLIDLAGHNAGNRLLVFARKPAPVQVKWVGYAGSTGLGAMDYLIADGRHIPEGTEHYYSETVIRLPDSYICYAPPDYAPDVGALPFARNEYITFGSFNNPAKINDQVLAVWAEILNAVPNARLFLKYRNMDAEGNCLRILKWFEGSGIDVSRVTLEGRSPHPDLLACYNDIDIALDTFPYTGGLTTCEALWMGVPVITVSGETFASRHSLSHLTAVGVADLIANDRTDYKRKAVNLAGDIACLSELRASLRNRVAASPLCDGSKFASDMTAAMRTIWKDWCSGRQAS